MGFSTHPDEYHSSSLHCHISASSNSNAGIGLGEGRGVINPIPHHSHSPAQLLQLLHLCNLVGRQHLGKHCVDPNLVSDKQKIFV